MAGILKAFRPWVAGACLLPGMAQASTALEFEARGVNEPGRVGVSVQDGMMRIEQGPASWMLYNAGNNSLTLFDTQRKSFVEMTREEMRAYGRQVAMARSVMDEHLKGMLPEQRAAIEKMMGGSARVKPVVFQPTGKTVKIAGYTCSVGRLIRGGQLEEEACLAAPDDIGMSKADFATVRSMWKLVHDLQEVGAPGILPDFSEINGVPIEIKNRSGDYQRVSRISHERIAEERFKVPAEYTRESPLEFFGRHVSGGQSGP